MHDQGRNSDQTTPQEGDPQEDESDTMGSGPGKGGFTPTELRHDVDKLADKVNQIHTTVQEIDKTVKAALKSGGTGVTGPSVGNHPGSRNAGGRTRGPFDTIAEPAPPTTPEPANQDATVQEAGQLLDRAEKIPSPDKVRNCPITGRKMAGVKLVGGGP